MKPFLNLIRTEDVETSDDLQRLSALAELREIAFPISPAACLQALLDQKADLALLALAALPRPLPCGLHLGALLPVGAAASAASLPSHGRKALVVRSDFPQEWKRVLQPLDARSASGMVALLGCAADPALLPERTRSYLAMADCVLHDRLVPETVLESIRDKCVYVGKEGRGPSTAQEDIHHQILQRVDAGQLVVRLHGGDPGIFGHLGETLEFLAAWGIRSEVVPAVTAAQMTAARAKAGLTHRHRGRTLTLSPAVAADGALPPFLPSPDQGHAAIYMGGGSLQELAQRLTHTGWAAATPIQMGQRHGFLDERIITCTLSQLGQQEVARPVTLLIGPVAHPCGGYTLFTGSEPLPFLRLGPLLHRPFTRLEARSLDTRLRLLSTELPPCRGLLFTSRFAVRCFMDTLMHQADARRLSGKVLICMGPLIAAALADYGIKAEATFKDFNALVRNQGAPSCVPHGDYLQPAASSSPNPSRTARLEPLGIQLRRSCFYHHHPIHYDRLPGLPFDRVLFTSAGGVAAYFEDFPEETMQARIWLAVGESTLKALDKRGLEGRLVPRQSGSA